MTDRKKLKYYLKGMERLMAKADDSFYVENIMSTCVEEEEVDNDNEWFGDGSCMLDEIRAELEDLEGDE